MKIIAINLRAVMSWTSKVLLVAGFVFWDQPKAVVVGIFFMGMWIDNVMHVRDCAMWKKKALQFAATLLDECECERCQARRQRESE
jgi:hypothetical protein